MLACVGRAERRWHGSPHVHGLLLVGHAKSIEPLTRCVPDADVQALQQFRGVREPVRCRLRNGWSKNYGRRWPRSLPVFPNKTVCPASILADAQKFARDSGTLSRAKNETN
jgi:hypothetical protein